MAAPTPDELIEALRAAAGDPALLALTAIDMAHPDVPARERDQLRAALAASAVPHWFSPPLLQAALEVDEDTATIIAERLAELNVVERFGARGADAANVHEASRLALRRHLYTTDRERFLQISGRIAAFLEDADDIASRIERIYHLLPAEPDRATSELERAGSSWLNDIDARQAAALEPALFELLEEGFLTPQAELRARITIAMREAQRGVFETVGDADEILAAAQALGNGHALADAYKIQAAHSMADFGWAEAWSYSMQAAEILTLATADDPDDPIIQSELADSLTIAGVAAEQLERFADAVETMLQALKLRRQMVDKDPTHTGHRREHALALGDMAELSAKVGWWDDAAGQFQESIEQLSELHAEQPDHLDIEFNLMTALNSLAGFEADRGDPGAALRRYGQTAVRLAEMVDIDPSQLLWRLELGICRLRSGGLLLAANDLDAARSAVEEALTVFEELTTLGSESFYGKALPAAYRLAAEIAIARNEFEAAKLAFEKAELLDDAEGDE